MVRPVHLFAVMVVMWEEIALVIILDQGIIGMPVTAKDHHLMVGTGIAVIPEEIMS